MLSKKHRIESMWSEIDDDTCEDIGCGREWGAYIWIDAVFLHVPCIV